MRIETEAFLMGSQDIHSTKSGKDFVKVNLIIEGEFVGFFTRKSEGEKMKATKPFIELAKTSNPTRCTAVLDVKFGQRGTYVDLVGLA